MSEPSGLSAGAPVEFETGLDLGARAGGDRFERLLNQALAAAGASPVVPIEASRRPPAWPAILFGLDRARLFRSASKEAREAILRACERDLLREAHFIEKAGMAFAARMVLDSASVDERMLYGLFAADEARHFALIRPWLPEPAPADKDPFLTLLAEVIESGSRPLRLFVIQVVLEGWGLTHYRRLAAGCGEPQLKTVLESILRDEARHHGSGVLLFRECGAGAAEEDAIVGVLDRFLGMVRCGPQAVVAAVEEELGGLTRAQRIELFTELEGPEQSAIKLALLRSLMEDESTAGLVGRLDELGGFRPLSAEECA